jgi:hypothetical protein
MTNEEADEWLAKSGSYRTVRGVEMLVYEIHRKENGTTPLEVVGFGVPDAVPPPPMIDVKRFLVRWFVGVYGP